MSHKQIYYSDKYDDDKYEYRCVWLIFIRHVSLIFCQSFITLFYDDLNNVTKVVLYTNCCQ